MSGVVAISGDARIARPLPVLVPLIKDELAAGDRAGLEHYCRAGEMLLEARAQVAPFKWSAWLAKHFELSRTTAFRYMRLAERVRAEPAVSGSGTSISRAIGEPPGHANRATWSKVAARVREIDRDALAQERQTIEKEIRLHREIALELIDLGYRALATRLHPDKGGSRDAMRRLNRVRDELKSIASQRRFV